MLLISIYQNEQNNLEQINLQFNKSSEKSNDVKIQVQEFQSQQRELVYEYNTNIIRQHAIRSLAGSRCNSGIFKYYQKRYFFWIFSFSFSSKTQIYDCF
ncbi:hypothetical protein pb186bvf_014305 [Paramecium bursaria]